MGKIFNILNQGMGIFFVKNLGQRTIELFLSYLEKVRYELNRIITRQDLAEQQLQDFLEKHYFLLLEEKPIVKRSRELGAYRTDFTLDISDGSKVLVELQLNNDPIIIDVKPSYGLSEAITQVTDWFKWIKENDLDNLSKYYGMIIIGRKTDYEKNKALAEKFLSETNYRITLKTYDDLNQGIDRVRQLLLTPKKTS